MNKAALIEHMAKSTKMPKSACKAALESFIDAVQSTLKKGKDVVLTGFGTYTVIKRKARIGINPATGNKMTIPAKRVPKFKPGKQLKDSVL
ncbi:MAG: Histone family protein DNA-binding protein [candidate division TM6 bacterium GW2011_GWF2_37_49]|nr:MAG: Histone family protein DNA-binding protein [candidate division TM6 bacterium GW2011_GWF2_37_49]